jgi:hypothetical protein
MRGEKERAAHGDEQKSFPAATKTRGTDDSRDRAQGMADHNHQFRRREGAQWIICRVAFEPGHGPFAGTSVQVHD